MLKDQNEFLQYVRSKNINGISEPLNELESDPVDVLNELDPDITTKFNNNGYVVIDNLLKPEYALRMRNFVYTSPFRHEIYSDYSAIDFFKPKFKKQSVADHVWYPLLTAVVDSLHKHIRIFDEYRYLRGWAFIHNNIQTVSVLPHQDIYSDLTLNIWVTPDQCVDDSSDEYNGIVISNTSDLSFFDKSDKKIIPYKFNRAMIFRSDKIHCSLKSRFKLGYDNRKVNYTFLFGKKEINY